MSITHEIWAICRDEYICGKGSLAVVAARHELRKGSVEKRARKEDWTRLRSEFEAAQLAKLLPPVPAMPLLPPVVLDGGLSEDWLRSRLEIHYYKTTEQIDKARAQIDSKLSDGKNLEPDELAKLCSALSGIATTESQLLGLKDKRKGRRGSYRPVCRPIDTLDEETGFAP
jgi:hypothetical protein